MTSFSIFVLGLLLGFPVGFVLARFYFRSEAERELEFIERGRRDDRGEN